MKLNKLKTYKLLLARVNESATCFMSILQRKLVGRKNQVSKTILEAHPKMNFFLKSYIHM